jgi:hypothetical protein
MRISTITIGAAFIAAAALSACAGRSVVPSEDFASGSGAAMLVAPAAASTPSPCNKTNPPMYDFYGACAPFTLHEGTATVVDLGKVSHYGGIVIDTTYSKNSGGPSQGVPAVMGDALGTGDIKGMVGGKAFQNYGATNNCIGSNGKPAKCVGKAFVYAELINNSNYTLKPAATPGFAITDTHGYPGKTCFPSIYKSGLWQPENNLSAHPNGNTLILPSATNTGQLFYNKHAQFIVAGVCE